MNYDCLAPHYQWIEKWTIGSALQRARTAQLDALDDLPAGAQVLIVGEGDGSFLAEYLPRFPQVNVTVVEASSAMVDRARERVFRGGLLPSNIHFITSPLEDVSLPPQYFDLVVTLFFFDNFSTSVVEARLDQILKSTRLHARILLADFCIPEPTLLRLRAQVWLWALYFFFRSTTQLPAKSLPDTEQVFENAGLSLCARETFCGQMLYSALYRVS